MQDVGAARAQAFQLLLTQVGGIVWGDAGLNITVNGGREAIFVPYEQWRIKIEKVTTLAISIGPSGLNLGAETEVMRIYAPDDSFLNVAVGSYSQNKDFWDQIIRALRTIGMQVGPPGPNEIDISSIVPSADGPTASAADAAISVSRTSGDGAPAESATKVMKSFGLIGTWSMDCSKDIETDDGVWTVVDLPRAGPPRLKVIVRTSALTAVHNGEVTQAIRAGQDKLKYTWQPKETKYSDGRPLAPYDSKTQVGTYAKAGSQVWILDNRTVDGSDVFIENGKGRDGRPVDPMQQCSSRSVK